MKAMVYERYGSADVPRYSDVEVPGTGADTVLVGVRAASINYGDRLFLHGSRRRRSVDDLTFLAGLVETGTVTPVIERIYPLRETADAIRLLEAEHARGKIVLRM